MFGFKKIGAMKKTLSKKNLGAVKNVRVLENLGS